MPIPVGVTTATVHHEAPVSITGEPGWVRARFTPSASLIWEATGTPLAAFYKAVSPENGEPLEIDLPHTDQPGFVDGAGNTITGWYYSVRLSFFKDGQDVTFPPRDFQLSSGQTDVDLALIPFGEAMDPSVAPMAFVTSVNGQTGDIEIEGGVPGGLLGAEFTYSVPAATWIIAIPAEFTRRPTVSLYDPFGELVESDVVVGPSTVTVTFSGPFAGTAVLN